MSTPRRGIKWKSRAGFCADSKAGVGCGSGGGLKKSGGRGVGWSDLGGTLLESKMSPLHSG